MSFERAKENLEELGRDLNLQNLNFDENKTCILGIDDKFSLHVTYEENTQKLFIYAPVRDGLPEHHDDKFKLYEALLEGSLLGGQMAGGGVGIAPSEGLILMHYTIEMRGAPSNVLRESVAYFIDRVEYWRTKVEDILEGRETTSEAPKAPNGNFHNNMGMGGDQGFVKV